MKTIFTGISLALLTIIFIEYFVLFLLKIATPAPLCMLAVSCISYKKGRTSGLWSSFVFLAYYSYFLSEPDSIFQYSSENVKRLIIWSFATPALAFTAGEYKERERSSRNLAKEREQKSSLKSKKDLEEEVHLRARELDEANKKLQQEIRERRTTEEKLNESYNNLRELNAHIQLAREEERKLIAREIHDELGQVLTALKIDLSLFPKLLESPSINLATAKKEIRVMGELVDQSLDTVSKIVEELRPIALEHSGLLNEIESQAQLLASKANIKVEVFSEVKIIELPPQKTLEVFRVLQEALTNILRHAQAKRVKIFIRKDLTKYCFEVIDDGIGIREEHMNSRKSFGILGMKERATMIGADLKIQKLAKGTGIFLTVQRK